MEYRLDKAVNMAKKSGTGTRKCLIPQIVITMTIIMITIEEPKAVLVFLSVPDGLKQKGVKADYLCEDLYFHRL